MGRIIKHAELDERLDRLAGDQGRYDEEVRLLIEEVDEGGARLEISDPSSYRKPAPPGGQDRRVPLRQQFRADVESIDTLDRTLEAKLARRIEFARRRLDRGWRRPA